MSKLPTISGPDAVHAFEKDGWRVDRQRGSHVVMLKEGFNVSLSIPQHRELAPGTLRSLIRASGMSVSRFVELL